MVSLRRALTHAVPLVILAAALPACGSDSSSSSAAQATSVTHTVTSTAVVGPKTVSIEIPGSDRFAPFAAAVAPDGTITITNKDTDEHTVTSLPGAAVKFDVHVKGGETQTLKLPPGVYRYYCTIHAKYVAETDQIASLPTSNFPDQPMEGVFSVG